MRVFLVTKPGEFGGFQMFMSLLPTLNCYLHPDTNHWLAIISFLLLTPPTKIWGHISLYLGFKNGGGGSQTTSYRGKILNHNPPDYLLTLSLNQQRNAPDHFLKLSKCKSWYSKLCMFFWESLLIVEHWFTFSSGRNTRAEWKHQEPCSMKSHPLPSLPLLAPGNPNYHSVCSPPVIQAATVWNSN